MQALQFFVGRSPVALPGFGRQLQQPQYRPSAGYGISSKLHSFHWASQFQQLGQEAQLVVHRDSRARGIMCPLAFMWWSIT
jgi:hypothetical protein